MNLIKKLYSGNNANTYEQTRKSSNKWLYEETCLIDVLKTYNSGIKSIVDAPVGTGRFFNVYENFNTIENIYGLDFSKDMLKHAKKRAQSKKYSLIHADIINNAIQVEADLVICYRFLNLLNWDDAKKTIVNLLHTAQKYALLSIRLVDDAFYGETYVEDKIYLHRKSDFRSLIDMYGFEIITTHCLDDKRVGVYQVVLCKRNNHFVECRKAKSGRYVFEYFDEKNVRKKLYQAHNSNHAEFIKHISTNTNTSRYFPEISNIFDNYLEVEWVNGESEFKVDYKSILGILFDLYSVKPISGSQFDYVNDLVIPRFMNLCPVFGKDYCYEIVRQIQNTPLDEARVSHPDLTLNNIIRTKDGYKVIDNELLCYSKHYHIDLLNILKHAPEKVREKVFTSYLELEGITCQEYKKNLPYLSALWLAREAGSDLIKGNMQNILEYVAKQKQNQWILPFERKVLI